MEEEINAKNIVNKWLLNNYGEGLCVYDGFQEGENIIIFGYNSIAFVEGRAVLGILGNHPLVFDRKTFEVFPCSSDAENMILKIEEYLTKKNIQ